MAKVTFMRSRHSFDISISISISISTCVVAICTRHLFSSTSKGVGLWRIGLATGRANPWASGKS
ncbi:hypothetical protein AMTR_s00045p00076880 [Amborella trichopoda]|uniref:Uncharacterized protein n=1 Tax=Amborella trichopoda TaxID=13333 RepID=W1P243_AMBTC|nr:hypothetical protein AMTR_s00045p00076880 [Amborella trichopoda]